MNVALIPAIVCLAGSLAIVCGVYVALAIQMVRVRRRKGTS